MRLNQYIAHSGICSRREADKLIKSGQITVNDKPVENIATPIEHDDRVKLNGKMIRPENKVYILLNKPKDFITTTDDEKERKTVLDLVKPALKILLIKICGYILLDASIETLRDFFS